MSRESSPSSQLCSLASTLRSLVALLSLLLPAAPPQVVPSSLSWIHSTLTDRVGCELMACLAWCCRAAAIDAGLAAFNWRRHGREDLTCCCRRPPPGPEQSRASHHPDNPARVNLPPSRAAPKPAAGKKRWHMPPAHTHPPYPGLTPPEPGGGRA